MNVKALDGRVLNFWVARSAGENPELGVLHNTNPDGESIWGPDQFNPANNWSHAGAIICEEWYAIEDQLLNWFGPDWPRIRAIRDEPLKWFLRAFVAIHYGDEVEERSVKWDSSNQGAIPPEPAPPALHAPSESKSIGGWLKRITG